MSQHSQTVTEIVNSVLTRIRGQTGTSGPLFATVLEFFNDALQEFMIEHDWNWLRKESTAATVADTKTVTLPEGVAEIQSIWTTVSGEDRVLYQISEARAKLLWPDDSDTGTPVAYMMGVFDVSTTSKPPIKTIEIKPTPDDAYTLNLSYDLLIKNYNTSPDNNVGEVAPIPQYAFAALKQLMYVWTLAHQKNPQNEIDTARGRYYELLEKCKRKNDTKNRGDAQIDQAHYLRRHRTQRYTY